MSTDQLETEVKFFLVHPGPVQDRLRSLGACDQGRVFESNTCYDTPQRTIVSGNRLVRLRRDGTCRLTLKSKPTDEDAEVKIYRELEVEVSHCDTMEAILGELGYFPVRVYEKWRWTFSLGKILLCLDHLPYGDFLEIEGEKQMIRQTAATLGLAWDKRILTDYLAIFDLLREQAGLPFTDPTFAHFQQFPVRIEPYLAALEAGK